MRNNDVAVSLRHQRKSRHTKETVGKHSHYFTEKHKVTFVTLETSWSAASWVTRSLYIIPENLEYLDFNWRSKSVWAIFNAPSTYCIVDIYYFM